MTREAPNKLRSRRRSQQQSGWTDINRKRAENSIRATTRVRVRIFRTRSHRSRFVRAPRWLSTESDFEHAVRHSCLSPDLRLAKLGRKSHKTAAAFFFR